ncbi:MAG TPA: RNA polymerase sigma factor [Thermoanaerobaculia bacterium]
MPIRPAETASGERDLPDGVEELLDRAYHYAISLTHDSEEAEDLLQDACLAMISTGAGWDRAYLFATVRNRFIDRYRRNKKVLFVAFEHDETNDEEAVDLNWDAPDVLQNSRLANALGTLRPEEREALFLAIVEGYTAEEISGMTARSRGTILSLLHRAKRKLRALLQSIR